MAENVEVQIAPEAGRCPSAGELAEFARLVLGHEGSPCPAGAASVTVRVVGTQESRALNYAYRGRDQPTNVLAFRFEPPPGVPAGQAPPDLGDVVVCAPPARREAREQGKPERHHWAHLVVHGALHLMGFDHRVESEAARMEALERELLGKVRIPDPYRG